MPSITRESRLKLRSEKMDNEKIIQAMAGKIDELIQPEKVILYGSHAYGRPTIDSDVDLMVVMRTTAPSHKRVVPIRRAMRGMGLPEDIMARTPEEYERFCDVVGTMVHPAAKRERVLYER